MSTTSVVEAIRASREQSRAAWEQAIDTSRLGTSGQWTSSAADCDAEYARALALLDEATACLEKARTLESEGGDDQHARRALAALLGDAAAASSRG